MLHQVDCCTVDTQSGQVPNDVHPTHTEAVYVEQIASSVGFVAADVEHRIAIVVDNTDSSAKLHASTCSQGTLTTAQQNTAKN